MYAGAMAFKVVPFSFLVYSSSMYFHMTKSAIGVAGFGLGSALYKHGDNVAEVKAKATAFTEAWFLEALSFSMLSSLSLSAPS